MCDYTQIETLFKTMNNVYSLHHAISFRYCSVHSSQIRADYPRYLVNSSNMRNFANKFARTGGASAIRASSIALGLHRPCRIETYKQIII